MCQYRSGDSYWGCKVIRSLVGAVLAFGASIQSIAADPVNWRDESIITVTIANQSPDTHGLVNPGGSSDSCSRVALTESNVASAVAKNLETRSYPVRTNQGTYAASIILSCLHIGPEPTDYAVSATLNLMIMAPINDKQLVPAGVFHNLIAVKRLPKRGPALAADIADRLLAKIPSPTQEAFDDCGGDCSIFVAPPK